MVISSLSFSEKLSKDYHLGKFCSREYFSENAEERFNALFVARDNGCWDWIGARQKKGYGVFTVAKHVGRIHAHRASWIMKNGKIPKGIFVLHKCDNPPCVNPDHLFLGDNTDNMRDKIAKGRGPNFSKERNPMWKNYTCSAKGEDVGGSKLKPHHVLKIRTLSSKGFSQNKLARMFEISQSNVWAIIHKHIWRHI